MEESEKINGKKRLPSIPSNYVTLLQLQERWIKGKERKQKGMEEKEEPQQQQEEKETNVEERVNDEVSGRESRKNGRFPRFNRDNGKRVAEGKPMDEKTAAGEGFENEKKGEELKKKMKKKWKKKKRNEMEEEARVANEGEEVTGRVGNAPLPASMERNKGEEELIGNEVHALKLQNVEARRESQPRFISRTHGRMAEIGRKFQAMSMNGDIRTGYYRRYGRQNVNFNHHGGNPELNRRYYGKFDRRRELNQKNEVMVWVKKEEVKDQNVSGIQSSSCSSKELD